MIRHKEKFVEMFGNEAYEAEVKKWSRTRNELRDEKSRKKREKENRQKETLQLERMKTKAYIAQTNYACEKSVNSELEDLYDTVFSCERVVKQHKSLVDETRNENRRDKYQQVIYEEMKILSETRKRIAELEQRLKMPVVA